MNTLDPTREIFEIQAQFARVMGHARRLHILHVLAREGTEVPVADLIEEVGISKARLSQHLAKMTASGVVSSRQAGRFRYVRLTSPEIGRACELIRKAIADQAHERHMLLSTAQEGGVS